MRVAAGNQSDPHDPALVIPSAARDLAGMRSEPASLVVYMLASHSRVLYTGSTNDLHRRVYQHKHGLLHGFTREYRVTRLVWFECHESLSSGVARERQIEGWRRAKKVELIESINAGWLDLASGWFPDRAE